MTNNKNCRTSVKVIGPIRGTTNTITNCPYVRYDFTIINKIMLIVSNERL